MKIFPLAGPLAAAALLSCVSAANAGILIPIPPVQGSTTTAAHGINDDDVLTGYYQTSDGNYRGFFGTIDGNYQTFDAPTGGAEGRCINNKGYITLYSNPSGDNIVGDSMLRKPDGSVVPITRHGTVIDGYPSGIIGHQNFVGERWELDENQQYLYTYGYYGRGSKYRSDLTLPFSGVYRTRPRGLNSSGEVVGYYRYTGSPYSGFVLKDGKATTVTYPDQQAYDTYLNDVNDHGEIVGDWDNQDGTASSAFIYHLDTNTFDSLDVPGSTLTFAFGINKAGVIAISSDVGPFLYCPRKKGCPGGGANGMVVKERHLTAGPTHSVPCRNGCLSPWTTAHASGQRDVAGLRAAMARDPELQREMHLPFRP